MTSSPKKLLSLSLIIILFIAGGCDQSGKTAVSSGERIVLGQHEHAKTFGDYTIHVNALTTDQLPSDVAKTYKIQRSKSKAMLNVVIMKNIDGVDTPVTGTVLALTRNLASQVKDLKIQEIKSGDAIYYIGTANVANAETLVFDIDATPANESTPFLLRYQQQFFTE
ncbi:MAG: DUF4426 domain-containing protein [Proteobacteria bacterium]|nr:DUF4426 domain-containing protein [Pseudomonadota bacterium]